MLLISIFGDFHSNIIPIFFEFKDKIKKHVIIVDGKSQENLTVDRVISGLNLISKKYDLDIHQTKIIIKEDKYSHIQEVIKIIREQNKLYKDVFINVSDGIANIGIILATNLLSEGVKFISYDKFDNEYNLLTLDGMTNHKLTNNMGVHDHIIAKGFDLKVMNNKSQLSYRWPHIRPVIRNKNLISDINKSYHDSGIKWIYHKYPNLKHNLKEIRNTFDNDFSFKLYFKGAIFEDYIYYVVKSLRPDSVESGILITYDQDNRNKNEFDVLFTLNNHLHIIECKMGRNVDLNNLMYKYNVLNKILDDDSKSMIVMYMNKKQYSEKEFDYIESRTNKMNIALFYKNVLDDNLFIKRIRDFFNFTKEDQ